VFLSPRNHINIQKRAINVDDFQRDDLCRTLFEYYDKSKYSAVKKVTFALREKENVHKDSVQILSVHSYGTVQFLQSVPTSAS
jgi:hypothetical protein